MTKNTVYLLTTIILLLSTNALANDAVVDSISADIAVDSVMTDNIDAIIDSISADNTVVADSVSVDSVALIKTLDNQKKITDSLIIRDTAAASTKLSGIYWGFGIGLALGSVPIFTTWEKSLPSEMSSFGVNQNFGRDPLIGDTAILRYRINETPDPFNIIVPFSVSINHVKNDNIATFALSYFRSSKQFQAQFSFDADTLLRRVNIYETMAYTSFAAKVGYQWGIPSKYFNIDKAERAYFSIAAGISPLNIITRSNIIKNSAPENDVRMSGIMDTVSQIFSALSANGISALWRIGINTVKKHQLGGGIEMGLFYCGAYNTSFYNNGKPITEKDIYGRDDEIDKKLSFIATRIEFNVSFLIPATRKEKKAEQKDSNFYDTANKDGTQ